MAFSIKRAFLALAVLVASASSAASAPSAHNLPIFFFHGINGNAANGDVLKANLSTEARPLVALSACETVCTLSNLNTQAALATKQIRELIANDTRFANGYVFVAHSLGAAVARAVIETMDDHKVHTFISLAGAVNGLAFGAQPADSVPAQLFLKNYAPIFYGATPFNYSSYTIADLQSGKFQVAVSNFLAENPQLQVTSGIQLVRSPVQAQWIQYNSFYAPLNNLPPATSDAIKEEQARRKRNFLKLSAAHFFASSFDETIAPWQAAQLGQYQAVASVDEYAAKFSQLPVVSAQETVEYKQDTYGLKTLDERKGLFFHTIDNVPHSSWIKDSTSPRDGKVYAFAPVYEKGLYPILAPEPTKDAPAPKPNC